MTEEELIQLEQEISILRETLRSKEKRLQELKNQVSSKVTSNQLTTEEITRYSRQIIMPQIQLTGQIALKKSKILIVGAGGLGCPAAIYLTAAGIGEIHIMDYDDVELSNLHRQILHQEDDVGLTKVQSAYNKLTKTNHNTIIVPLRVHANSTIVEYIEQNRFDVVIDCSDNVPTRYLLNDVCVIHNIPLISGSALQMEGQLTVYHYKNGPCYRCLFPVPPPAYTVTNCGDGGVLGTIPGTIGVLQALEAIKIITKQEGVLSGRLLLFDGSETIFRNVRLRSRVANCDVCGDMPTIKAPIDYEAFCGSRAHDKVVNIDILKSDENIHVKELPVLLDDGRLVLDVRPKLEYDMCNIPNTVNIPYGKLKDNLEELQRLIADNMNVYVLCRRGNDSQRSIEILKEAFCNVKFINVLGGLHAYSKFVDDSFPVY